MGVFDDKKYEQLDWISKAVEPIDAELTKILENLPERVVIDFNMLCRCLRHGWRLEFDQKSAVLALVENHNLHHYDLNLLASCYKLEANGRIFVDFKAKSIVGELALVRIRNTFEEKELQHMLGRRGLEALQQMRYNGFDVSRMNEILELLGKCEEALKTRSTNRKFHALCRRYSNIMENNEFNIRNVELSNKVGQWIADYILNGNLAAFSNFCKLKVMTHKELPIYSVEEVV